MSGLAFPDAIEHYRGKGLGHVLPLPAGKKHSPPSGYTGRDGATPSEADLTAWADQYRRGNTALRLAPDVIGIDVDAYKDDGATLAKLEAAHGPLPPTMWSSARRDGPSGIRFYRADPALIEDMAGNAGPNIETIRHGHRYAAVWPSIHPNGSRYIWRNWEGQAVAEIPAADKLARLPDDWVRHLLAGEHGCGCLNGQVTFTRPARFGAVDETLTKALGALADSDRRHDTTTAAVLALVRHAERDFPGAGTALGTLRDRFLAAVVGDYTRTQREAKGEWQRMVDGAERIVALDPTPTGGVIFHTITPKAFDDIEPACEIDGVAAYRADDLREWASTPPEFRIPKILGMGTHGVVGGPKKSLKSTVFSAEMAVCLANGLPWLGADELTPTERVPVLVVVNEGHRSYMRGLVRVAEAKRLDTFGPIYVIPAAGLKASDERLSKILEAVCEGDPPGIVIFDALYGFVGGEAEASNLFAMRDVFDLLTTEANRLGFDLWLVHHYKKATTGEPDLDDLAWAGIAEWADSWLLFTHRKDPKPDEGLFWLGLKAGSRQWGETLWNIDVDLGIFDHETAGYTHPPGWGIEQVNHDQAARWGKKGEGAEDLRNADILQAVSHEPWELTKSKLAERVGGTRRKTLDRIDAFLGGQVLTECEVETINARGQKRTHTVIGLHPSALGEVIAGVALPREQEVPSDSLV